MKTFITLAALAVGSNALVGRSDSCCFHLTSSGGASGELGQLDDGQNRIGDNSLSPAQYCIDAKGAITDAKGRGCILTRKSYNIIQFSYAMASLTGQQPLLPSSSVTRVLLPLPVSPSTLKASLSTMAAPTSLPVPLDRTVVSTSTLLPTRPMSLAV